MVAQNARSALPPGQGCPLWHVSSSAGLGCARSVLDASPTVLLTALRRRDRSFSRLEGTPSGTSRAGGEDFHTCTNVEAFEAANSERPPNGLNCVEPAVRYAHRHCNHDPSGLRYWNHSLVSRNSRARGHLSPTGKHGMGRTCRARRKRKR